MRWYRHRYHTPFAHQLVFSIIPRLPKGVHPPIAVVTALIFFLLLGNERRAVVRNLRRICPGGSLWLHWEAYKVFFSFCDFMVSYCYVPHASHDELLRMLSHPDWGAEQIERCLEEGKGLIVWTAHLGNWEFASRLLEMHGRTVNIARMVESDNPSESMLRDLMTNERLRIVELNHNPLATVELLAALRAGEIVAMQGDRIAGPAHASFPFFGEAAHFPLGPFVLSHVSGAPILPGLVVRDGWLRYRVIMGNPIPPASSGDRGRDLQEALERAVGFLEENVRVYHGQWLNFYDFWPASTAGPSAQALNPAGSETVAHD
jgi:KDO2-lipid IV(A) lauroyltransferase